MTTNRLPPIVVNDSTLRDGEKSPHVAFSRRDRVGIALALEQAGVDEIELCVPPAGGGGLDDVAAVAAALGRARAVLWGPMCRESVDVALQTGISAIHLSLPLSARRIRKTRLLDRIARIAGYACDRGLSVSVSGEDASHADFELICDVLTASDAAGANRFRYADTMGLLHPLKTHWLFRQLCAETDLELEFHGHDHFRLATANTLAAVQGGATHVSVSILDLGQEPGTAPLDEVVSAIGLSRLHRTRVDSLQLPALACLVASAARLPPRDLTSDVSTISAGLMLRDYGVSHVVAAE